MSLDEFLEGLWALVLFGGFLALLCLLTVLWTPFPHYW